MNCNICYNNIDKSIIYKCLECDEIQCFKCIISYEKFRCMFCENDINSTSINEIFKYNKKSINLYKTYYVDSRINNKNPESISLYDITKQNKLLIRWGTQIKVNKNFKINIENILSYCPRKYCKGMISKQDKKCPFCNIIICEFCLEEYYQDHSCDANILKNMQEIKKDSKNCPNCFNIIFKSSGCDDMVCTGCGIFFFLENYENNKKY